MRLNATFLCLALAAGSLVSAGCTTLSSSVMVPGKVEVEKTIGGSVRIETIGSPPQMMIGSRLIPPGELEEALRELILRSHLFDTVVAEGESDRVLRVEFESIQEPEVGLDAECTLALRWRLMSGDGQQTLWERVITTDETVNSYQESESARRSMAVLEKTVQANLKKGVERLSRAQGLAE